MEMTTDETLKRLYKAELEEYAIQHGYKLGPNADRVIEALFIREERLGEKYCPCRVVQRNYAYDQGLICPCIYHVQEIKDKGRCTCKLFYRSDYESKHELCYNPHRR